MEITINNTSNINISMNKACQNKIGMPAFMSKNDTFLPSHQATQYKNAKEYVDSLTKKGKVINLEKCNLNRLEGIQHGIEVFDGLNIKQIFVLYKHLKLITTYRGCSNGCIHCFADAKPHKAHTPQNEIQAISWEDFGKFTSGFKELDKRLGFSIQNPNPITPKIILPFLDADSMEIILKDKNGKEYDMLDIAKAFDEKMNKAIIFDTSGWTPTSKKMQQRAEKYVQYMLSEEGKKQFFGINVSLNPFHKLNAKYVEYITSNPNRAKKFRDLYTKRMANVFYTFTPLFENPNFRLLNRAFEENIECDKNYKLAAHLKFIKEIRNELELRYIQSGMSKDDITKNLALYDEKTKEVNTRRLIAIGRLKNLFPENSTELKEPNMRHAKNQKNPIRIFDDKLTQFAVDCNGKVYATDMYNMIPLDFALNFENKNKSTPKFFSPVDATIETDELIKLIRKRNKPYNKLMEHIKYFIVKQYHYLKSHGLKL